MEKKVCCICGQKFEGWGNNPWGKLGKDGKPVEWKADDCCCDLCNSKFVIPGRLKMMYDAKKAGK